MRHELIAGGPNELWLTEVTEHRPGEGKLCVCAIKDVCSNRAAMASILSLPPGCCSLGRGSHGAHAPYVTVPIVDSPRRAGFWRSFPLIIYCA